MPAVTVIMPILNEESELAAAVGSVLAQEYPGPLEVVLALGPSSDRTDAVAAELAAADPRVRWVMNPSGHTPEGLNAAIQASSSPVVVRMDGHGEMSPHYIRTAVTLLLETGAANVGGLMAAQGRTPLEKAVAAAMTSVVGLGASRFHTGGAAGPNDTVFLGVFRREWLERVGGYDPAYRRAQDWEMNYRIRQAGGVIWFTPELQVTYRPRSTFAELGRQYFRTGQWRRRLIGQHRESVNLRYLAPPAAVLAVVGGAVGGLVWRPLWVLPAGYLAGVAVAGVAIGARQGAAVAVRTPPVIATMHMAWGAGFLVGTRD